MAATVRCSLVLPVPARVRQARALGLSPARRPGAALPKRRSAAVVLAAKKRVEVPEPEEETLSGPEQAVYLAGLLAAPVTLYSEFVLKSTGCGLPPGPGGSLGALEGISYLVVVGVVGLSTVRKVQTGSGVPPGPGGAYGASEGLAFLAALAGIVVAALVIADTGSLPYAVPDARCFG